MAQTEIEPTVKPEHAALIAELEAESSYVKLSKFLESLPDTKDGFDKFLGEIKFGMRHHFPPEKFAVLAGILTQIQENKTELQKLSTLGERKRRLRLGAELAADDYLNDPELTIFTKSLEGEPFYELGPDGKYQLSEE